jgi:hypothetical protein
MRSSRHAARRPPAEFRRVFVRFRHAAGSLPAAARPPLPAAPANVVTSVTPFRRS